MRKFLSLLLALAMVFGLMSFSAAEAPALEASAQGFAGNRLGGNAVTEIIVSGRTAAQTVTADNK